MAKPLHAIVGQVSAAAVIAAARTGLFEALATPRTSAEIAGALGLAPRPVALVLDVLCELGCVARRADRYVRCDGALTLDLGASDVCAFLDSGVMLAALDAPAERAHTYARTVVPLGRQLAPAAAELAAHLEPAEHILDVGAGSGVWSLAMAARDPSARVTALDLPAVLPCVVEMAKAFGLADRVATLAADYASVELTRRYDRVVLANVLHLEDAATAASMIERFAAAVNDRGELVIVDITGDEVNDPNDGRDQFERALGRAAYALHLGMRTTRGAPHPLPQLRQWARDAGLARQRAIALRRVAASYTALVCRRPE